MKYFLDTSVQIERNWRLQARRERVESILHGHTTITSSYVYKEYLATMIHALVAVYNVLQVTENFFQAMQALEPHFSSQFKRYMSVLSRLGEEYGSGNWQDILDKLDRLISYQAEDMFWLGVSEKLNLTDCEIARRSAERRETSWYINRGCRKNPPPACDMCSFFKTNQEHYQNLSENLVAGDPEMRKMVQTAAKCVQGKDLLLGNNCHDVSDATIILEAPNDSTIVTTNGKHFEPLCNILGKKLKAISFGELNTDPT